MANVSRNKARLHRHQRVRKTVFGVAEKPRLCVFRSLNDIYAQIIDDEKGVTLVASLEYRSRSEKTGPEINQNRTSSRSRQTDC